MHHRAWGRVLNLASVLTTAKAIRRLIAETPDETTTVPKMRIQVFAHDSNPACDTPIYHQSATRAAEMIIKLQAERVGERAIRLFIRDEKNEYPAARRFDDAWQLRPSDGYAVWQLRSGLGMHEGYLDRGNAVHP